MSPCGRLIAVEGEMIAFRQNLGAQAMDSDFISRWQHAATSQAAMKVQQRRCEYACPVIHVHPCNDF